MTGQEQPGTIACTTLPSGVRVVTEQVPGVRSAAVGFWVGVGSRDESGRVAGATHFLEHLLFKGTRRRTALQIAQALEEVGGDLNAFTSKEYTCFYARCLDRDLPQAIDVLGDMIADATVTPEDVEAERDVVLEEIAAYLDTPDDLVHSVWHEAFYGTHPLGREVLGDAATIRATTRDDVVGWYRQRYVPGDLVVAVAGNLTHESVCDQVSGSLRDLDRAGAAHNGRRRPDQVAQRAVAVRQRPVEQVQLVLGTAGLARDDEDRFAAAVVDTVLGGGMASRLFQEVRERQGLAYGIYSYRGHFADSGTFGVATGTSVGREVRSLQVIHDELARALHDGLTLDEIDRARRNLAGSTVLALEDTGSRMSRIGRAVTTGSPLLTLDELLARIEGVTSADVDRVLPRLLDGPWTLAVVGPETLDRDGLERALPGAA